MKNIFVPSGTLTYFGTYQSLANMLYGLRGKMDNNGNYYCYVSVPRRNRGVSFVIVRGRTSYLFRGCIIPSGDTYKITYKVFPSFSSSLLLLVPVLFLFQLFDQVSDTSRQQIMESLCAVGFVSVLLIGLFLFMRSFAIRRFIKIIEQAEEEFIGIFD